MLIIHFPTSHPYLFWTVAIFWSVFQAYAGHHYGLFIHDKAFKELGDTNTPAAPAKVSTIIEWAKRKLGNWYPWLKRILAYGFHHGVLYFACSLFGFVAWYVADEVSPKNGNGDWSAITTGMGTTLIALAILSIVGISGALPRIFYLGNRPL